MDPWILHLYQEDGDNLPYQIHHLLLACIREEVAHISWQLRVFPFRFWDRGLVCSHHSNVLQQRDNMNNTDYEI